MGEFKVIETQEQLDHIVGERLARERDKVTERLTAEYNEKYSDYDTLKEARAEYDAKIEQLTNSLNEANEKLSGTDQTIGELNKKIAAYETDSAKTRIAIECGIPIELANRLTGTTEEEIRKDAENLSRLVTQPTYTPPSPKNEPVEEDGVMAAFRKLNPNIII